MSTVREILEDCKKLCEEGNGDLEVICIDCRSGDSNEFSMGSLNTLEGLHGAGVLCDEDIGYTYVSGYVG